MRANTFELLIEEDVLCLDVAVNDAFGVAVSNALEELHEEGARLHFLELRLTHNVLVELSASGILEHHAELRMRMRMRMRMRLTLIRFSMTQCIRMTLGWSR